MYAVEASAMSKHAETLVKANGFSDVIKVVKGKVEEIDIPEKVDVIISEPMGFMLIHERMLESYVEARNRFLKPGGLMFPSVGTIYMAPFSDSALYVVFVSYVNCITKHSNTQNTRIQVQGTA